MLVTVVGGTVVVAVLVTVDANPVTVVVMGMVVVAV